jgi:hypothetical protein
MTSITLTPSTVGQYNENGIQKLLPVSERELQRAEAAIGRVLSADALGRGRHCLIISTLSEVPTVGPLERALMARGLIICNCEASPYDGARVESTIRRFDIALIAPVSRLALDAIAAAGFDPEQLFQGKIVWAKPDAYIRLRSVAGLDVRRWLPLGPAVGVECRFGGGAHVDGKEWHVECDDAATYITSRLDRAMHFERLRLDMTLNIEHTPCSCGATGPRVW